MFFKKKITVEDYCSGTLKALFSPERELVYERLRDACADRSLSAVDQKLYFDHIRAVIVELVNIAIIKNCGLDISSDARLFIVDYLRQQGLSHIDSLSPDSLTGIYNRAFGTPGQDGVASIAAAFSKQVTDSQMRPETTQRFYVEFYAILKSLFDELKALKVLSAR
jgi:hypothetical protein